MKKSLLLSLVILCSVTFQAFSAEPLPTVQEVYENIYNRFNLGDVNSIMRTYQVSGQTLLSIVPSGNRDQLTNDRIAEMFSILETAAQDKYINDIPLKIALNECANNVLKAGCTLNVQACLDKKAILDTIAYNDSYRGIACNFIGDHYKEMLAILGLSTGAGVTAYYATPYINNKYGYNLNRKKVAAAAFVATAAISTGVCYYRS